VPDLIPKDATAIKDLKPGDDFTGKINAVEVVVADGVATGSWVETKGVQGTLEQVNAAIAGIENDIAYRQSNLALFKNLRDELTK